ncbi:hypothetical protein K474DRAFT_1666445 [Panus rudis PR-1116 ss-1]|nr:hypothetical protein K474DRAFT_1666445 [Panus rudis PR-1116 ss-1]
MFKSVVNYFHERRKGLTRTAGYVCGIYLAGRFVIERLEEVRDRMMEEKLARENLRRRFEQNQQDISYTVMALLPTLGAHILNGMDVEGITQDLQAQSRAAKAVPPPGEPSPPPVQEPKSPNGDSSEQDTRSENGSISVISAGAQEDGASTSDLAASSNSWVDQFSSVHSSEISRVPSSTDSGAKPHSASPKSSTDLSDSIITDSSAVSYGESTIHRPLQQPAPPPKTKAELWREVKMLTFTRTLTILYSTTLLTLFTNVQLSILGRSKYVQSVVQQAHEERMREQWAESLSLTSLLWSGRDEESLNLEDELQDVESISEETERKFLTLTWWILHVGWKDVGERVRRGVEEVFESISLKTKLSANELHRLVSDVRRRVEFEVTFEGRERRINFNSTLLPPTSETLHHALVQGGIPAHIASTPDPTFSTLLAETREHLASSSFQLVLEACLDRATEILFDGLEKSLFQVVDDSKPEVGGWEESTGALGPEIRVRLVGMLPGLAKWCHTALEGLPNELVDGLNAVREVNAFSAIIFAGYEDRFR